MQPQYKNAEGQEGRCPQSKLWQTWLPGNCQSVRLDGCHKSRLWAQGTLVVRLPALLGNGTSQLRSQTLLLHSRQKLMEQLLPVMHDMLVGESVADHAAGHRLIE